jgi:glycerophosphoryl diester phosphodiesterase
MPKEERDKLKQMIDTAHKQGRKVRFWATDVISKNQQNFWRTLQENNVDYIGTDKLRELHTFLTVSDKRK